MQPKSLIIHTLMNTRSNLGSTQKIVDSYFQSFLYGFRNEMSVINLEATLTCVRRACFFIKHIGPEAHILFVNTNSEYNEVVKQACINKNTSANYNTISYVNHKWTGGLITNWNHMQYVLSHFQSLGSSSSFLMKQPLYNTLLQSSPRFKQMKMCFEGLKSSSKPDCIVVLNGTQNEIAIREAYKSKIPIISLVDSSIESRLLRQITYPIPGNESSIEFVYLLCNCILKAIR